MYAHVAAHVHVHVTYTYTYVHVYVHVSWAKNFHDFKVSHQKIGTARNYPLYGTSFIVQSHITHNIYMYNYCIMFMESPLQPCMNVL